MPEIGRHTVEIQSHDIATLGSTPAVKLFVLYPDGEDGEVVIWLSEKSMGIARKSLKLCGFDPDTTDFGTLADVQEYLKGRKVDVICEEWNGKVRAQIALGNTALPKKDILSIQSALRAAKGKGKEPEVPQKAPVAPAQESNEAFRAKREALGLPSSAAVTDEDIPF